MQPKTNMCHYFVGWGEGEGEKEEEKDTGISASGIQLTAA